MIKKINAIKFSRNDSKEFFKTLNIIIDYASKQYFQYNCRQLQSPTILLIG